MNRRDFFKWFLGFIIGGIIGYGSNELIKEKRIEKKRVLRVSAGCIGCGACGSVCPTQAVFLVFPCVEIDKEKCIGCRRCEMVCPMRAIKLSRA